MSNTAKEIAVISQPGSANEKTRQQLINDVSKAFGEGAVTGASNAFPSLVKTNSYVGSYFVDKTAKKNTKSGWFW